MWRVANLYRAKPLPSGFLQAEIALVAPIRRKTFST